ncbi:MAG TPA: ORF6N domain-containing protein [Lacunisphaera sp.]|nr:ORF6N domain-containing protein [Lacunisphaera sp.]
MPPDFCFQLTAGKFAALRSQFATLDVEDGGQQSDAIRRGQFASGPKHQPKRGRHRKFLPWAFTEYGAVMAANVLRSPKAVEMSVYVVRAFIAQRELLATNAAIMKRLAEIDKALLEHDSALISLWEKLQPLLAPPPEPPRREMGFHTRLKGG